MVVRQRCRVQKLKDVRGNTWRLRCLISSRTFNVSTRHILLVLKTVTVLFVRCARSPRCGASCHSSNLSVATFAVRDDGSCWSHITTGCDPSAREAILKFVNEVLSVAAPGQGSLMKLGFLSHSLTHPSEGGCVRSQNDWKMGRHGVLLRWGAGSFARNSSALELTAEKSTMRSSGDNASLNWN